MSTNLRIQLRNIALLRTTGNHMTLLTDHVTLASLLVREKRTLEAVHDSHVQMRLLLEAGDSRYLGWAVDDLVQAADELNEIDRTRRSLTGTESANQWIESASGSLQRTLQRLTDEIDELLQRVEEERARARAACHVQMHAGKRRHR